MCLGLVTQTKLEKSRLNKLHAALQKQQKSVGKVYAQILTLSYSTYLEYSAVACLEQETSKCIRIQQNVQQAGPEEGMEALGKGAIIA